MIISRRGARADHGASSVDFPTPSFEWRKQDKSILIKQRDVKDFSTTARHGYTVQISPNDVNSILGALASAAKNDPVQFEKLLEPSLKALLQLAQIALGCTTVGRSI